MPEIADRKLYLGPRLRVLRRELGINQSRMAEELGVSPSYLNHLERNQRPLTAQMLLRLANTYDIDIRDFVSGSSASVSSDLHEAMSDALVRDIGVPRHEVSEVAENYPGVAEAITRLYRALTDLRRIPDALRDAPSPTVSSPLEWLRGHIEQHRNHFAEIDAAAEAIATGLPDDPADLHPALHARLKADHGITVHVVPEATLAGTLRHYDFHRKRLMLSQRLEGPARRFAAAFQLALGALDPLLAGHAAAAPDAETRRLLHVALANYAAAAIVMPYARLLKAAEDSRYDLPLLQARFGVSFEQLAHRLTSLGRSGARGIPFFLLKLDSAGIVSKRFEGERFPFARFGGVCPRWSLHRALASPGTLVPELVETPDGHRFVTLIRAAAGDANPVAVALGCEARHADRIVHADGLGPAATSIGPTCHLCERTACSDRALPPATRGLEIHAYQRTATPYPFRQV